MPLIIHLHGGTVFREGTIDTLKDDGFPKYVVEENALLGKIKAYVLIPKLSSTILGGKIKGWSDASSQLKSLIGKIVEDCHCDKTKLTLAGHSIGGTGVWQLPEKLPSKFARVCPMSGSVDNNEENKAAFQNVSVWAFVGSADTTVLPEKCTPFVNTMIDSGADFKLTTIEGATHFDVPEAAFLSSEYKLLEFLQYKK